MGSRALRSGYARLFAEKLCFSVELVLKARDFAAESEDQPQNKFKRRAGKAKLFRK
jgi:hypothetical protein